MLTTTMAAPGAGDQSERVRLRSVSLQSATLCDWSVKIDSLMRSHQTHHVSDCDDGCVHVYASVCIVAVLACVSVLREYYRFRFCDFGGGLGSGPTRESVRLRFQYAAMQSVSLKFSSRFHSGSA